MEFTALQPTSCPRCHDNAGIPVAVAQHPGGHVIRFVCPLCRVIWDDQPEAGETYEFKDEFIDRYDRQHAIDHLPFTTLAAYRDHFR